MFYVNINVKVENPTPVIVDGARPPPSPPALPPALPNPNEPPPPPPPAEALRADQPRHSLIHEVGAQADPAEANGAQALSPVLPNPNERADEHGHSPVIDNEAQPSPPPAEANRAPIPNQQPQVNGNAAPASPRQAKVPDDPH